MLRLTALLALAAVCVSALPTEVPESVMAFHEAQGEAGVGRSYYFPCDAVSVKAMTDLDLDRFRGHWFSVNAAFATSHHTDSNKIQEGISKSISCLFNDINTTNPHNPVWEHLVRLRQALPANVTVPGFEIVDNRTGLLRSLSAYLPRPGSNGQWLVKADIGTNATIYMDLWIAATDYTSTSVWYMCADVPVPGTADTSREQQWGILRRRPRNLNMLELAAVKLLALKRGIIDIDRLYTYPTDGC